MNFRIWMIAGLLLTPLLPGCGKKEAGAGTTAAGKFDSPWACEEHWMVARTVKDLQGMAKLCGVTTDEKPTMPGGADHEYHTGGVVLKMAPSCWDVASYKPLLDAWKFTPQPPAEPAPDVLHDLLTPTIESLQKANKTVSARIKAAPAAAQVHEEAAFVLGVLGIRENARQFNDLRPLLCRMTAHLALADQLRGVAEPSLAGRWAQVFYNFHAGRPLKAREKMQLIAPDGDSSRWKRAMDLLITGDWRQLSDPADASLIEAIAQARALRVHRGTPQMMEFVTLRKDLQATAEWPRLLMGDDRSVDDGHLVMSSAVPLEFQEMREIFPIGEDPDPAKVGKFLSRDLPSQLVADDGSLAVISASDWAAYFRRHFYHCCSDVSRFAQRKWASQEAAVEWEQAVLPYCRNMADHELVEPLVATREPDLQEDLRKTADFILHHPERVPMGLWFDYRFPNVAAKAEVNMPDQVPWFREASPRETAHDPLRRIRFSGIHNGDWLGHIRASHAIDPWNFGLCFKLAELTGNSPDSIKAAWGNVRDYSTRPLSQTLQSPQLTVSQRLETLRLLADLDPEEGLELGAELVMEKRPEEAIHAYETAYAKTKDRVAVSNQTRWMIHYYKSHGQEAKAREVADHNAEVFSQAGLETALALAIEEKDVKRAGKIAADIEERYDESLYSAAVGWYLAGKDKELRQIFPDGLQSVTLADLGDGRGLAGCRLEGTSPTAARFGMQAGDVILAIDGKRVKNFPQYRMLTTPVLDPHTRIIFRRGKTVKQVECVLPDRRIYVNLQAVGN